MKYIARKNTWFDEGTEVTIIDDYRLGKFPMNFGLFCGLHNSKEDEEICGFYEFDEVEGVPIII